MIAAEFLTTGDVARMLDCSPDYVRQLTRAGRLPASITRSGLRLFAVEDVEQFAQAREAKRSRESNGVPA
jgi:excisionase family DNA binding protein